MCGWLSHMQLQKLTTDTEKGSKVMDQLARCIEGNKTKWSTVWTVEHTMAAKTLNIQIYITNIKKKWTDTFKNDTHIHICVRVCTHVCMHARTHTHTDMGGGEGGREEVVYRQDDRNTLEPTIITRNSVVFPTDSWTWHFGWRLPGNKHLNNSWKNVYLCRTCRYEHDIFTAHGKIHTHVKKKDCITHT